MRKGFRYIAAYIQTNCKYCRFVGYSDDGELFVTFTSECVDAYITDVCGCIKGNFPDEVLRVTVVEKLDVGRAESMLEELNIRLDEPQKPKGSYLLQIDKF